MQREVIKHKGWIFTSKYHIDTYGSIDDFLNNIYKDGKLKLERNTHYMLRDLKVERKNLGQGSGYLTLSCQESTKLLTVPAQVASDAITPRFTSIKAWDQIVSTKRR